MGSPRCFAAGPKSQIGHSIRNRQLKIVYAGVLARGYAETCAPTTTLAVGYNLLSGPRENQRPQGCWDPRTSPAQRGWLSQSTVL